MKTLCNQRKYSHICLVGDFNYGSIDWEHWTTNKGEVSIEANFLEALRDCFLFQNVTEPTRCRGTDDPSLLDLILTNEEDQVSEVEYHAPLGKSDHSVLTFEFNCYLDLQLSTEKFLYEKADYDAIRDELTEQDWCFDFQINSDDKSVQILWEEFKSKLLEMRDKFVPKKKLLASSLEAKR